MKATKFMMMAAAAMMIAACSSSELDSAASGSDSMIALDVMPMVQGQTRAEQITTANIDVITVEVNGTFCKVNGDIVTNPVLALTNNGSSWTYTYDNGTISGTGPLYWPKGATTTDVTFSAYSRAAGAVDESTEQTDIVGGWATKTFNGKDNPGAVAIELKHAVSKMQFKARVVGETADPVKVKIDIREVAIRQMGYAATYAIPTASEAKGVLTLSTNADPAKKDIVIESSSKGTFIGQNTSDASATTNLGSIFMVPQTIAAADKQDLTAGTWTKSYISILAQIRIEQSDGEPRLFPAGPNATDASYAWIALPLPEGFTGMQAHKKYVFTLNFSADALGKVDRNQHPPYIDDDGDPETDPDPEVDPDDVVPEGDGGKDIAVPDFVTKPVSITVNVYDFENDEDDNVELNMPNS